LLSICIIFGYALSLAIKRLGEGIYSRPVAVKFVATALATTAATAAAFTIMWGVFVVFVTFVLHLS
jgi:hypothetical protein